MRSLKCVRTVMLGAACVGIVLPTSVVSAANPSATSTTARLAFSQLAITDVALGKNGTMRGLVVDAQGMPVRGAPVVVRYAGRDIARVAADQEGCFQVTGLRGGVYHVFAAQGGAVFRLWAPDAAPPAAKVGVVVVAAGETVVRGQRPLGDYFASDRFILMSLIGAAIAIPVVVYNNRTDPPSGS